MHIQSHRTAISSSFGLFQRWRHESLSGVSEQWTNVKIRLSLGIWESRRVHQPWISLSIVLAFSHNLQDILHEKTFIGCCERLYQVFICFLGLVWLSCVLFGLFVFWRDFCGVFLCLFGLRYFFCLFALFVVFVWFSLFGWGFLCIFWFYYYYFLFLFVLFFFIEQWQINSKFPVK